MTWSGAALLLLVTAVVLGVFLVTGASVKRDPPRDLPWVLPDYRLADTGWEIAADGSIHAYVEHFRLVGISPAMVSWFYRQLPISTVELAGRNYPLYHLFHPTEHGRLEVLEAAADGTPGMGEGALVMREEWFGSHDSRGVARLVEFSDAGMLAVPEFAGLPVGRVRHSFRQVGDGTAYRVETVIGSDLPVLGPLINLILRSRVFHPRMLEQWQRHQVEEVASLQFFLPQIYAQRDAGNHFILEEN